MDPVGEEWPDIEGAMRDFLRADSDFTATFGNRAFFSSPAAPYYPMVLITRIGGASATGETPLDNTFLQIDVFSGLPEEVGGGKRVNTEHTRLVRKILSKIRGSTRMNAQVVAFDARVASQFYSPIRDDNRPRTVITVTVSAIYDPV